MARMPWQPGMAAVDAHWPEARGLERAILASGLVLTPKHPGALAWVCRRAPAWRRRRGRRRPSMPLRVLHTTASFDLGGTQRQIKNLCESVSPAGHQHLTTEIFHEHNFIYRQGQTIDAGRYSGRGPLQSALGRLTQWPDTRSLQLIQIHKLRRDIRQSRPDVVVGWGHEIAMLTFVAAALERVPHIVFCIRTLNPSHGWTTRWMGDLLRKAHRAMFPLLSGVIVNSALVRADYSSWLEVSDAKTKVCPNGIDLPARDLEQWARRRAEVRDAHGIREDTIAISHVGRFSAEKGHATILKANEWLLANPPSRRFVWLLAGDGALLPEIEAQASTAGMDNIRFLGRSDAVEDVLCAADIFVMPSDFEGMPNAMMEAMGVGLPCVSSRLSGARDIARENIEALYCEARDPTGLAEHLAYLIDRPQERQRLGEAAQRRMHEFTVSRMTSTFDDILESLTRRKTRGGRRTLGAQGAQ